jgi:hypothetical protein
LKLAGTFLAGSFKCTIAKKLGRQKKDQEQKVNVKG